LSKVEGTHLTTCYFADAVEAKTWLGAGRKAA
jgi:hypothetical protein